ncbi:MAG: hypothetical protein WA919_03490 [Coleofasciculaceae cyanobacterium]
MNQKNFKQEPTPSVAILGNHSQSLPENSRLALSNPQALPCQRCGSQERKSGVDKAPREASLLLVCGKFIKWLSASFTNALAAQLTLGEV